MYATLCLSGFVALASLDTVVVLLVSSEKFVVGGKGIMEKKKQEKFGKVLERSDKYTSTSTFLC
jgi:hypothetical protein